MRRRDHRRPVGAARAISMARIALLVRDRSGATAVEFAVCLMALLIFIFAIINLGDLALTVYALNRGVAHSANYAALQASDNIAAAGPVQSTGTVTAAECPGSSAVQSQFAAVATPPYSATNPPPTVAVDWWGTMAICGGQTVTSPPLGGGVTVTVKAPWSPLALSGLFGGALTLSASQSVPVPLAPQS